MFPESTCLKTNFGTYLEFLVLAVAEKFLGKVEKFGSFFAFPAKYALTKIAITFDRLNQFYLALILNKISKNWLDVIS